MATQETTVRTVGTRRTREASVQSDVRDWLPCQLLRSRKVTRRKEKRERRVDCQRKAAMGPSTV